MKLRKGELVKKNFKLLLTYWKHCIVLNSLKMALKELQKLFFFADNSTNDELKKIKYLKEVKNLLLAKNRSVK